ncbi:MAG TPA: nitroreductase/quinone reductase family protein [Dehalococcoidia bacterium]|nr:nitroreductase/quinone reductase family protein [Dehalococcoidia bacterium]
MEREAIIESLRNSREIRITVRGRRSGRAISLPVWFVLDEERPCLWLLPIRGSRSPWFRNLEAEPALTVQVGDHSLRATAVVHRDPALVEGTIERFKARYTAREFERYYSGVDVAIEVPLADER